MKRVLYSMLCITLIVSVINTLGIKEAYGAANKVTGVLVGSQTGTMCAGSTNSVTYTITLNCNNDNQNGSSVLSLTGSSLPTGVTAAFSSGTFTVVGSTVTVAKNNASGTVILTLTSSASSVAGTTTGITITTTNNAFTSTGFSLTISGSPSAVTVGTSGTYCNNTTLTASGGTGGTIYWQNTTSNGTSTATASTSQLVSSSGTYYFRSHNSGCWGTQGSATVTINTIAAPTANAATSVTSTSFSANWSSVGGATGYYLDVATDNGFTSYVSGYNNLSVGNVTTYSVTGLSANTTYYYRVRAIGATCTSLSSNTITVSTLCGSLTLTATEGFNTSGTAIFPACWTQQQVIGTSNITFQASGTNPTVSSPYEGSRMVYWNSYSITDGNQTRLVSAPITTTGTSSVDVEFMWYHGTDGGSTSYLTEGVQLQYSLDGTTWNSVGAFVKRYDATSGWTKKTFTLPAAAGNKATVFVGFLFTSNYGYNCYLDLAVIKPTPTCFPPTATTSSSVTATSATISWTAASPAPSNGYTYEVRTSGAAGSGATGLKTSGSTAAGVVSANITGLTAVTTYYVYVRSYCGGSDYSEWTSSYSFTTTPSCITPTGVTASSITTTTATISWTAASPAPSNGYQYEIRTSGAAGSGATGLVTSGTTVAGDVNDNLTGLTQNTTYYVYVRSDCSASDYSAWTSSYSFTTACGTISSLPWTQNFDAVTTPNLPSCWAIQDLSAADDDWMTSTSNYSSSPNCMYISWDGIAALNDWAFSPGFSLTGGTSYRLEFKYRANSGTYSEKLEVFYGTSQTAAGMTTELFDNTGFTYTTYQSVTVDFTPGSNGTYYFGWHAYSVADMSGIHVDDIAVSVTPSCLTPTAVTSSAVTSSSATISWTAPTPAPGNGYQYEIRTSGAAGSGATGLVTSGTTVAGDVNDNLSSLTPNTTYYVYVRSDCGSSDYSLWTASYSFTTTCVAYTVPYFEGFESGYTNGNTIAGCLLQESVLGAATWVANSTNTTYNRTPRTGSYNATLYYSNDDWIFIPINLTNGADYQITLYARQDYEPTTYADITIKYGTTASAAGMTNSIVAATGITNGAYQEISGYFSPSSTGVFYVGILGSIDGTPYYISLDDISIEIAPTCVEPTNLAYSNVTTSTVDLTWTASISSPSNGYDFYYSTSSTEPNGSTTPILENQTGTSKTITGLNHTSTYYLWIRSDCGAGDLSVWEGPISFSTPCGNIATFPWLEPFDSYLPSCWSEMDGTLAAPSTVTVGSSNWISDGYANNGTTGAAKINIYSTTCNDWIVTPSIDLGSDATNYQLEFDLALTDYGTTSSADLTGTDDKFAVVISTDNGATWTSANTLRLWNNSGSPYVYNNIPNSGQHITIDLTAYSGVVKIGFYGESLTSNADNDLFIDNVTITPIQNMAYVSSTTTQNTASVAPGTTNQQVVGVTVNMLGTLSPLSITSLTFNTNGTTSVADISNARLWYTGTSSTFSATGQFGSVVASPNGSFNFTGTQQLSSGANYFWLTYDIPAGATMGNVVDAECNSITIGSAYTPTVQAPTGSRLIAIDYCDPAPTSVDGSGITNVTFGTVNNTTGAETGNYGDYTAQVSNVNPGETVPVSITYSTGYTYYTKIWIDWNKDGDFTDTGEEVYSGESLSANPTTLSASFAVPGAQATGTYTMRIGGCDESTPTPCYTGSYGSYEDYSINVVAAVPMTFISCTTTQTNTSTVSPGTFTQEIIGVRIVTAGSLSPLDVSSFTFNITGTTDAADISNATLWTTGLSGTFATTTQIGDLVSGPSGSFTINTGNNLPYTLSSGTNYFWLTYDVPSTATIGNFLDAVCTSVTVGGSPHAPTVPDPAGNRVIDVVYCNPTYSYSCNLDYISNVTFNGINNTTTCSGSTPSNFTLYSSPNPSFTVGQSYALSVTTDGDDEGITVWIDYNHDGLFTSNEIVLTGYNGTQPATYSTTVTIPGTAMASTTRMRVRCGYAAAPTDPCSNLGYGETEDYQITIIAGCTPPTVSAISASQTVCSGASPGTDFSLTVSGGEGSGPYSYLWYKNGSSTGITTSTYNPGATTAQTSIYCIVKRGACAIGTQSPTAYVFVEVPFVNAEVSTNAACSNTILNLTGNPTGMTSYSWTGPADCTYNPNATSQSPAVTMGSTSGSFTLTVTSANGCTASAATGVVTVTAGVPGCAGTPSPAHNATAVGISTNLTWAAVAGATSYDVYFGIGSVPSVPTTNVSTNSYSPTLAVNTTYVWKIVPRNGCGTATGCTTVWNFATVVSTCIGTGTAIDPTAAGGFESGATLAANGWYATTSSSTTSTQFVCNTGATAGFTGTRCGYVTNNTEGAPPPHDYEKNRIRVTHLYRDFTIPAGATNIKLDFKFIGNGEANKDYLKVWLVPSYYEPAYGAQITSSGTAPYGRLQVGSATYSGQAAWTNVTGVSIANSYAGLNSVRIVFEWTNNDNSSGTNPPAGIDNVSITYTCPLPACSLTGITFSGTGISMPALDPELNDGILYIDVCQNEWLNITPSPVSYDYDWVINAYDGNGQQRYTASTLSYQVLQASGYDGFLIIDGGATCYSWHPIRIRSSAGPTYVPVTLTFNGCAGSSEEVSLGSEVTNQVQVNPFAGAINSELGDEALTYIPDGPYCDFCYESQVTFTDFPVGSIVETVDDILFLRVKMEHSNMADIQIKLKGPNECGEAIILQDYLTFANSPWAKDNDTYYYPYPLTDRIAFGIIYDHDLETSGQPCNPQSALNYQGTGWEYCWSWNSDYDYASGYVYSPENHQHTNTTYTEYTVEPSDFENGTNFYHPFETYDDLVGCPLNGTWSVQVCDSKERDNGWIFDWHLGLSVEHVDNFWTYDVELDHVDWTGVTCVTPTIVSEQSNPLVYDLTPNINSAGNCTGTFTIYDEFGCTVTSPATTFGVTPIPTVTGIANGDYVWAGLSTDDEWTSSSAIGENWYYWNGTAFNVASVLPSTQNVHIIDFCSNTDPTISSNAKCNNLSIWSGKVLTMDAVNLELTGNWNNQGTFTAGTGTVIFNGTGAQSVTTTTAGGETFYNLEINNSGSGITFNQNALVSRSFTMSRGNIFTGSNVLSLGTSTSNLGSLNRTDGTIVGNFRRWFDANTVSDVLFPVGTATNYRPAVLHYPSTAPTTGGTLTASFIASDPGSSGLTLTDAGDDLTAASPDGYWPINAGDGLAGGSYNLDLYATGFGVADYTGIHIIKRANSSSNWVLDGTHVATTGSNALPELHRTGMTGFSEFGVGGKNGSLPVELLSFTAVCNNGAGLLEWSTASETNNAYYVIEKSKDMKSFTEIASISGMGSTSQISKYEFIDKALFRGNNYYRLKQVDNDGLVVVLDVIVLNCERENSENGELIVYPNPFNDELFVIVEDIYDVEFNIIIYDEIGKEVYRKKCSSETGYYQTTLGLKQLRPGVYYLHLVSDRYNINSKIVKK